MRYEYLNDTRVADRGITSFQGRPADVDPDTFYGNPDLSDVEADVNVAFGAVEHRAGRPDDPQPHGRRRTTIASIRTSSRAL